MPNDQFTLYTVLPGDSIWKISRKYNITTEELLALNDINSTTILPGQKLKVPLTYVDYTVQSGDSLWFIANKYNMSVEDLKRLNQLTSNDIVPGQILKVVEYPIYSTYIVSKNDSLWTISNHFGMSIEELKTLNHLTSNTLYPSQHLTIIKRELPPVVTDIIYVVKSGDSLWDLANRFNTSVNYLMTINGLKSTSLSIGQKIIVSKKTTPTTTKVLVKIKRSSGVIQAIPIEEYVTGVVSSELSDGFNDEAYKAQALAARTYAAKRADEGKILSDTDQFQVYKDKTQLKAWWGKDFDVIYNKINRAVQETLGEVIIYDNKMIDALFFSTSNGKTENPVHVWGGTVPYLKVVNSKWDTRSPYYYAVKKMTTTDLRNRLGLSSRDNLFAMILSRTEGDSVNKINIGGKVFTGEEVRKKLGLKSTDFNMSFSNLQATIEQRGWGHQVGLSQYGSHFMGIEGYGYRQIIQHYYPGTKIIKIR